METFTAFIIPTTGPARMAAWPDGGAGQWIRAAIKCQIFTCVALTDRIDMWLDDEALLVDDPKPNPRATAVAARLAGAECALLFGNAVLTGGADEEGETLPLGAEELRQVKAALE